MYQLTFLGGPYQSLLPKNMECEVLAVMSSGFTCFQLCVCVLCRFYLFWILDFPNVVFHYKTLHLCRGQDRLSRMQKLWNGFKQGSGLGTWDLSWCLNSVFLLGDDMPTAKQLADIGYKTFSTSMMLLTVYGGYLCSVRAYHFFQRRISRRQAAEEQKTSGDL